METKTIVLIVVAAIALITIPIAFDLINSGIIDLSGFGSMDSKTIRVAIAGRVSPELKADLTDLNYIGIQYQGEMTVDMLNPGTLNSFDIVILEGQSRCDRIGKEVIARYVQEGGKLIVVGDVCSTSTDVAPAVKVGTGNETLEDILPITIERSQNARNCSSGILRIAAPEGHPMFPASIKNFPVKTENMPSVVPKENAKVLAYVYCENEGTEAKSIYAIVESMGLPKGKVIYFGYEPGSTHSKEMLLNTLRYLKSA